MGHEAPPGLLMAAGLLPGMGAWKWRSPGPAETYFARWVSEEGFHGSRRMRNELGRRFVERLFEWVPYLYPDLDDDASEADEGAAIEAGTINATGFRYVGTIAR